MRRPLVAAAATALTLVATLAAAPSAMSTAGAAAADPVRIMPLGDSITGSPGCWRALLWDRLQRTGHTNIDFVGTRGPQGCGIAHDGDNEGHGGILATNIAAQNQLPGWLAATDPDIVLMHLGTNDVWSNRSTTAILAAYSTMVAQMRAQNPTVKVLVAQIIPVDPPTCGECAARTTALNQAIPGWAASRSTTASPIVVVDQWTGFRSATDTGDGVHPNDAGTRRMADRWYPAVVAALTGTTPSSPSPSPSRPSPSSPSPSPSPSPSRSGAAPSPPPPASSCAVTYRPAGQWQGGFQGEVTVTNRGTAAGRSWTATLTFTGGQTVSQVWGGVVTQSGGRVTIANAAWNGPLAAGGSATAGFIGSWSGTNAPPTATCTIS